MQRKLAAPVIGAGALRLRFSRTSLIFLSHVLGPPLLFEYGRRRSLRLLLFLRIDGGWRMPTGKTPAAARREGDAPGF